MSKFNFSLQKILDYRIQLEEEAKIKLGKAQNKMSSKIQEIHKVKKGIDYINHILGQGKISTPEEIILFIETEKNLLTDLTRLRTELDALVQKVSKLKAELLEKTIDRKKIEKLKEQQKKRFEYEERKKEQKEIEEISIIKYKNFFK